MNNKQIEEYVEKWMKSHEPDTFVANEHGAYIYENKHSYINIQAFFENLLEDFIEDNKEKLLKGMD